MSRELQELEELALELELVLESGRNGDIKLRSYCLRQVELVWR